MSTRVATDQESKPDLERRERAAALIRLISYARDEAVTLDAKFLTYCLEAALAAAQEDLTPAITVEPADMLAPAQPEPSDSRLSQLH